MFSFLSVLNFRIVKNNIAHYKANRSVVAQLIMTFYKKRCMIQYLAHMIITREENELLPLIDQKQKNA